MKPHVVGSIFARGGSKGVPRKNLCLLGGKPLLAYAVETARACKLIDRVVVSTDDAEIARIGRAYGAEVPFVRPQDLADDDSPEWLAWQHAIRTLETVPGSPKIDVLVSIPTTSPLRIVQDLELCIRTLLGSEADGVITVTPTSRSPYFNMVALDPHGYARLVAPPNMPIHRRQDAPQVFDMTTVAYAMRRDFVLGAQQLFEGKIKAVIVPPNRAIDIDSESDLKYAEWLISHLSAVP